MKGLESYRQGAVHTRNISIATYRAGDEAIMIEGTLRDDRLIEIYSLTTGEMVPPGIVHDITLRLLIGQRLEVKDFEVEMKHVPREECREMTSSLEPLIGRRISPGFTLWVKENLGGPKGCTHLNELLLAMAPASVQGLWSATASRPVTLSEVTAAFDARYLVDSCRVWRADGPLVMELRKTLEGNPSSSDKIGD
jgi:hypothetical protein